MKRKRFRGVDIDTEEIPFKEFVGDYVILTPLNGNSSQGRLEGISKGYALLNPHVGPDYTGGEGRRLRLIDDTEAVHLVSNISITPTTKKNLEAYCDFQNREYRKQQERENNQNTR